MRGWGLGEGGEAQHTNYTALALPRLGSGLPAGGSCRSQPPACKGIAGSRDPCHASTQPGVFWGRIKQLGVSGAEGARRGGGGAGSWPTFSLRCREEESSQQRAHVTFPQAPRKIREAHILPFVCHLIKGR